MKANLTFNLPNDLFKLFQLYVESSTFSFLFFRNGTRTQGFRLFR